MPRGVGRPLGSRLPRELQSEIRAALRFRLTPGEVCRKFGISRDQLRTIARDAGLYDEEAARGHKRCEECQSFVGGYPHRCGGAPPLKPSPLALEACDVIAHTETCAVCRRRLLVIIREALNDRHHHGA